MDRHKHTLENTQGSGQYGPLINVRDPLAPIIYTTTESEVSQHSHNCYKNETTVIGLHATPNQNQPVITSQVCFRPLELDVAPEFCSQFDLALHTPHLGRWFNAWSSGTAVCFTHGYKPGKCQCKPVLA